MRENDENKRDRKRDRDGWKAQRKAARLAKAADRGDYIGKRATRRAGKGRG